MYIFLKTFTLGVAFVLTITSCTSNRDVMAEDLEIRSFASFDEVQGKEWVLDEIITEFGIIIINRQKLEVDGMGNAFTLFIDGERISGKGAPNRFFSPYTLGKDQEIKISPIAGTLMMSIAEPEGLQEREFYNYLEQATQWEVSDGRLELYTETSEGDPVILIFN
jgi:heat shock protein HslJ